MQDGLALLEMRVKQLMKDNLLGQAALLAKSCCQCPAFLGRNGPFKQMYLVCRCATSDQTQLMEEVSVYTVSTQGQISRFSQVFLKLYCNCIQSPSAVMYPLYRRL